MKQTLTLRDAEISDSIYTLAFLINGINIISSAYFTAIAKAKESMIISLSRGLVLVSIGLIILPLMFNIKGIWLAVPIAEVLTLCITYYLMKKYNNDLNNNFLY